MSVFALSECSDHPLPPSDVDNVAFEHTALTKDVMGVSVREAESDRGGRHVLHQIVFGRMAGTRGSRICLESSAEVARAAAGCVCRSFWPGMGVQ
jgi:hypothetical protein